MGCETSAVAGALFLRDNCRCIFGESVSALVLPLCVSAATFAVGFSAVAADVTAEENSGFRRGRHRTRSSLLSGSSRHRSRGYWRGSSYRSIRMSELCPPEITGYCDHHHRSYRQHSLLAAAACGFASSLDRTSEGERRCRRRTRLNRGTFQANRAFLNRSFRFRITVEGLSGAAMFALTSRAGAAALAAPAEATTDSPALDAAEVSFLRDVTSSLGSGVDSTIFGAATSLAGSSDSGLALNADADAAKLGGATGFCGGTLGGTSGLAAEAEAVVETLGTSTGFPGARNGAGVAGFAVAGVEVALGFADSFLRNSPRATRNVPFACSTLMGLVRTRFAPIRNAFATPACPSTTATARADWLFGRCVRS